MSIELGNLERVDLREKWNNEAQDFTPWLAKQENLNLLSNTLDLGELELVDTNVAVGSYWADLVAKDISGSTVIVENQLEKTNHDHLGKIITYAAVRGAAIVIWICKEVTDDHRKAIDWLNDITSSDVAFFALEIELWKIGDSLSAPKFNVVCSPNEWARLVKQSSSASELTATQSLQQEFWSTFRDHMKENGTFLQLRKPRAQHWYEMAIGRTGFHISLTVNTQTKRIGCELYLSGTKTKESFNLLRNDKEQIESELGFQLDWQELPTAQSSRILLVTDGNIHDRHKWPDYFQWFQEHAESFHKAFSKRVKQLPL